MKFTCYKCPTQQSFTINDENFLLWLQRIFQHASVETGLTTQCCQDGYMCDYCCSNTEKLCCSRTNPCFMQRCFHVAPEIAIKRFKVCFLLCSRQLLLPCETAQETLGIEQVLLIIWWTRANSFLRGIQRQKNYSVFLQQRVHSHRKICTRNTCLSSCGKTESAVLHTSQLIVTKAIVECQALA